MVPVIISDRLSVINIMDFNKISIIGIGLIGSSFALALKKQGFKGRITGIGRNEKTLLQAKEKGIIDACSTVPAEGIKDADLIMLAAPPGSFEQIIRSIKDNIKAGAIVTDVGSVKAEIIKKIGPLMPEGVSFVGGHPIAGKESSGMDTAEPGLFRNAVCVITPAENTDRDAMEKVLNLWKTVGAVTVTMDPEEHDLVFAAVSHLPHVAAYAMINAILDIDQKILHNGGKGLKDMTRIALSPPELWRDICTCNRKNLLMSLKSFTSSISKITDLIERSDWAGLEKEFIRAKEARQGIESDQH